MKDKPLMFLIVIVLLVISGGACLSRQQVSLDGDDPIVVEVEETAPPETLLPTADNQPPDAGEDAPPQSTSRRYSFDQLGISLEVPSEMRVIKDPGVNYDDPSKLDGYLIYIQDYGFPGASESGDFQMYGHLQYNLPPITWEVFADNVLNSPMNAYATEIEVNGLRGFDTQLGGERNRFVYQFLLQGQVLSLAVSAPTEENKALADEMVSTLLFDPEKFTDASKVQKIIEPNSFYQIYLPDDWKYSFGTTAGIRLSDLQASSADALLAVEDSDGPHSNIRYQDGIFLSLVILDDDSANSEPVAAEIKSAEAVMYAGIEMTDYVFLEPSTAQGELRELRFQHNGHSYLLRFSYAEDADQELIDWIILHLEMSQ